MTTKVIEAKGPDGPLFAAIDPDAIYVAAQVCRFRFSAVLAPYTDEEEAKAALVAAGAVIL